MISPLTPKSSQGIKSIGDFRYYTGAHPKIRKHCRAGKRPKEFGDKVWATSFVMMEALAQKSSELSGLRVLEIGCGWGLLGVYLAKTQECQVTCTDLDENVLPIVQMHGELNAVEVNTHALSFNAIDIDFLKNFDVIVGVEVCYSQAVSEDLRRLMERAMEAGVGKVWIADPGRPDFEDHLLQCRSFCKVELNELPGTVNGRATTLLSATNLYNN